MDIKKLYSLMRQAINDYNLIEDGDKIAVGVSGGKDSLALLTLLNGLRKFLDKRFELMAITCDVGFPGMDFSPINSYCEKLGIPYEIVHTKISEIVFENNKDERPCSLCAKLRKGAMYERLNELGFNKIAYAHHKDDFIETAMMSLLYEGRFYSFPPATYLEKTKITVIRPMMYIPEKSVANFVEEIKAPVVVNTCPVDGQTKRSYARDIIEKLGEENREVKNRIMHAICAAELPDWPKKSS